MKKLLFFIPILLLALSSCTIPTFENSAENISVKKATEILKMDRDTVEITIVNKDMYVIKDNVIIMEVTATREHCTNSISYGILILYSLFCFIFGLLFALLLIRFE